MNEQVAAILRECAAAGWVTEPLARQILRSYQLPVSRSVWARGLADALAGADEIGYPLVIKVVSPQVVHKSDVGGVEVGVKDERGLREVYARMSRLPAFDGVLIDELTRGIEVIVGAKRDPQFGPIVMVGIGGTSVEIYKDVAIRMAPLSRADAENALHALQGRALLEGYRGAPGVHRDSLIDLLVRFSELVYELRFKVDSIDLNPVFCNPEGSVIADARIMLAEIPASDDP